MYNVKFSDKTKTPIEIDELFIDDSTSISLFGRKRLAYGEELQTDLVRILENFACPEDETNPGNPDISASQDDLFSRVVEGQFWYNSTIDRLFYYNGTQWIKLSNNQDYAANWGVIANGDSVPNPVSSITGYVFDYTECVWIVSPYNIPGDIDYMECSADDNAVVTSQYRFKGTSTIQNGFANYLIVGIRGNVNNDSPVPVATSTPTPTPTATAGVSLTPTPTVTRTQTPTPTPTHSVGVTHTPVTPSPTPTRTPPVTPTKTPAATHAPSPTPSTTPPPKHYPFDGTIIYAYSVGEAVKPGSIRAASVSITFNSSGSYAVNTISSTGNNSASFTGTWLPTGWAVSDCQIKFTPVATTTDDKPATITNNAAAYTSLSSNQSIGINASVIPAGAQGQGSSVALNTIVKRVSTGQTIVTNCTVKVDVASGV